MSKLSLEKVQLTSQQLKDHYLYHNKKRKRPEEEKIETTRDVEMDAAINRLKSNDSSLIGLRISKKNIELETLERLASALASNTVLTNLLFLDSPLCPEGVCILAKGIKKNISLTTLVFSRNNIVCDGAVTLANAIKDKNNFYLGIRINQVKDKGAIAISEVLKENKSLICLDLMSNEIGDVGATQLARAIEINTTLKCLRLSGNPITAQGGIRIAKSLEKNSTLRQLYCGLIGDSVAKEFISVLAKNTSLQRLEMACSANLLLGVKELCHRNISFCKHYETVQPKIINYSLGFFCKVPKDLRKIVTEYCEGEYPRWNSFQ